jgi:hypothetical protein
MGYVLVVGLQKEEYRILVGILEGKRSYGRFIHGFVKNINMWKKKGNPSQYRPGRP